MSKINETFKAICKEVLSNGYEYTNKRRGVTRLQIAKFDFEHNMCDGFPAIGLKKLPFNTVVSELIWFLRGSSNTDFLKQNNVKIWDKDEQNYFEKTGIKNDVGQNYCVQWRNYNGNTDQIQNLIDGMKKDINGSRLIVNAWNPSELNKTALPPCHTGFQIIGVENGFELHWYQRSVDLFLGLPFNIASYATLGVILQELTGHKFIKLVGDLKCVHFYDNQIESANELVNRSTSDLEAAELSIKQDVMFTLNQCIKSDNYPLNDVIHTLKPLDFALQNYNSHKAIKVDMIAPKSI